MPLNPNQPAGVRIPLATTTPAAGAISSVNYGAYWDVRGKRVTAVKVPAFGTATKFRLQGSFDGTTWKDLYAQSTGAVQEYVSSSGDFLVDADYIARFFGIPYLRPVISTAQAADIAFDAVLSDA
jgi:hypothetical protein